MNPDCIGSVLDIPFANSNFEVIACFELLEHLPYKNFNKALAELFRVSNFYTILSLPDVNKAYRINVQIPKLGEMKMLIPLPRFRTLHHKFDGEHYWEIGTDGCTLSKIFKDIQRVGFNIEKTFRVFENPYHRFFILKKVTG